MSDHNDWRGFAGDEVRKCICALDRANATLEIARNELLAAQHQQDAAERDLDIAKRVYHAGQQDQEVRIRAPKVSPQKQRWLRALAEHEIFGAGEMRIAAEMVDWSANDGALRTLASEYRKAGYFVSVAHGVMKLDRSRISDVLGEIFDEEVEATSPTSVGVVGDFDASAPIAASSDNRHSSAHHDEYDDDLPF